VSELQLLESALVQHPGGYSVELRFMGGGRPVVCPSILVEPGPDLHQAVTKAVPRSRLDVVDYNALWHGARNETGASPARLNSQ
jgi:hypothetical protein